MSKLTIGLLAHVDAGKTTLAESLLYTSGAIRSQGRVDHKDAYLDNDAMERNRGITIFSKSARFEYKDLQVCLLDTPGHVDFSSEMERTLSVLDMAILVISASEGIQGHTRTLWKLLEHYDIPTFIFLNKMDQPDTDRSKLIESLCKGLSATFVDMKNDKNVIMEEFSATDEELIEEYLESGKISNDSIKYCISERIAFPVWSGSALYNDGVEELLDGVNEYAPEMEYGDEFGARVFKITRDAQGKRLTHMKITGGKLLPRMILMGEEKVDQLRLYSGTKFEAVSEAVAGDIVAVTGMSETYSGQGFGIEAEKVLPVLSPVLSYRIELPPEADALRNYGVIKPLEEEYPELNFSWNERYKEIHVSVNGEVQIQVLKQLLVDRFNLEVTFGAGSIVYKETIAGPAYGIGHFEPLRHYAEVHLLLEPGEPGSGIEFLSACNYDTLDRNWQRLIQTHVEETIHRGVLTGGELTDIRIILMTGRAHPKHTEGGDFRQATYRAIRNACRQANSVLLEPVYQFTMDIPSKHIGRAMTDIERLYGKAQAPEMSADGELCTLRGTAPVSTFWEYRKELAAYTGGMGQLMLIPSGYMPCHNADEVVAKAQYDPEADVRRPTASVFCAHGAGFQVPWNEVVFYAHMECPIPPKDREKIAGLEYKFGTIYEEQQIPTEVVIDRGEEKFISIEEIDAIFSSQYRNRKSDNVSRRKVYKKTRVERDYSSPAGNTSNTSLKKLNTPLPKCLLVDGYNMIHAWDELKAMVDTNMEGARGRLIDICSEYHGIVGGELILVFDAYLVSGGTGSVYKQGGIHVVYTKEAETADQYIEQATRKKAKDYRVTVATSDRIEQLIVWGEGALRMSAVEFEKEIARARVQLRNDYLDKHDRLGNTLPIENIKL